MQYINNEQALRGLLSAVISRAVDDLENGGYQARRAWYFLQSPCCETYCNYLEIPIDKIKQQAAAHYND